MSAEEGEGLEQHLFIDFEFSMPEHDKGRNSHFPEIIEAGFVFVVNEEVVDTFSSFVKPIVNPLLTNRCKSFLQITQKDVDSGVPLEQVAEIYHSYINQAATTVVTWGNMDVPIMRRNFLKQELPYKRPHKELDLAEAYRRFYGDRNNTALRKAIVEYGKDGTGKNHRALDDALTTFEVFKQFEKDRSYLNAAPKAALAEKFDVNSMMKKLGFG